MMAPQSTQAAHQQEKDSSEPWTRWKPLKSEKNDDSIEISLKMLNYTAGTLW